MTGLDVLAARIRSAGRTATVVPLAVADPGDLQVQANVLNGYVNQALAGGSGLVIVIGYSSGARRADERQEDLVDDLDEGAVGYRRQGHDQVVPDEVDGHGSDPGADAA